MTSQRLKPIGPAFLTLTLISLVGVLCLGQTATGSNLQEQPAASVEIIHGPVVELITDSTAQIAWSTNVNASTLLRYGTDSQKLDQTASMPWGGLTHRVVLKNLEPSTTYYFLAESAQGQDTGTRALAPQSSFKTVAPGDPPVRNTPQHKNT